MTFHAIFHVDIRTLPRVNLFCGPVAKRAADSRFGMKPVGKDDIRRKQSGEVKGPLRRIGKNPVELFDFRRFGQRQVVAVHAIRLGWHPGPNARVSADMALRTIKSKGIPVFFVGKRNAPIFFGGVNRKRGKIPDDKSDAAKGHRQQAKGKFRRSIFQSVFKSFVQK